ncbi:hypothetical protein E2C01_069411 [Portunus trituberculatus]|uniref:Uncharacterized protein n=1 Tax=Portunus trituberculatus TaxID=210409 RepID=A0A5B7I245_PORTR|nr:hypothetical protein [Portunus trituberculatus]
MEFYSKFTHLSPMFMPCVGSGARCSGQTENEIPTAHHHTSPPHLPQPPLPYPQRTLTNTRPHSSTIPFLKSSASIGTYVFAALRPLILPSEKILRITIVSKICKRDVLPRIQKVEAP